jgi:PAS domain S-box-containing protein
MNSKKDMTSHPDSLTFLSGGGEMGERIRTFDWAKTPLGPVSGWSPALRTMLGIMLANRFPHILWWGPHYFQFYNDPYRPVLGAKHPDKALGQPASECWTEIWNVIGPLIDRPFNGGPATWDDDIFLEINRHGFVEECHFTIAYSPVPDETVPNGIGGVLATVHEITGKVVGDRRVLVLRDLGAQSAEARTAEDACAIAAKALVNHSKDIPFALLYLIDHDRKQAHLAGSAGVEAGGLASPSFIPLEGDDANNSLWPLRQVMLSESIQVVKDLPDLLGDQVPPGPWTDRPHTAVVIPVRSNRAHFLAGFLVVGISARLQFDQSYQDFLELVSSQIATAIANAREFEEEKKRAEALAEIDRAKTVFFNNVSHEFRTPLTLMLGPVEDLLATSHTGLSSAAKGQLEVVDRNGLRLLRLVNTLLDFSRIEAGRIQAVFEPTDLAAFTKDLISSFRAATERAGIRLLVNCPKLSEPVYVDRDMWEKIVLNLISNAFKFTFEGDIEVSLRAVDGVVELRVRDTGVGIPAEEMPRIFERFHRIQNMRSRTHEGSGIGLALVQELVKLHGGTVRAESQLNVGTTFIVSVPFGKDHLPPEQISGRHNLTSTAVGAAPFVEEALRWLPEQPSIEDAIEFVPNELLPVPCPPHETENLPRIFVVDDNADMRQYLARLLVERYNVQTFPDGQAALDAARERLPDLILSDVMMPRLDGFGLVHEIRADASLNKVPIILLSARAGEESRIEGLEHGADDYLIKPFSARELLARVAAHLDMARLRKKAEETLWESSAKLKAAIESMTDAVFISDEEGNFIDFNDAFATFHKFKKKEECAKTFAEYPGILDVFMADGRPAPVDMWAVPRALRGEIVTDAEYTLRRKDTGETWVGSYNFAPIRDKEGAIVGSVVIARDITERKRAEEALRKGEKRQTFLLKLSDALRPLSDPIEIQAVATRVLGEHLGASRAAYVEINGDEYVIARDYVNGIPSMAGRYPVASFGPGKLADYRAGKTRVICDTRDDPCNSPSDSTNFKAINAGAGIGVPLVKEGVFVASLVVHMNVPRNWTPEEVALVEETAERTWAAVEQARAEEALRESEERFRAVQENSLDRFTILKPFYDDQGEIIDFTYIYQNAQAAKTTGRSPKELVGLRMTEIFPTFPQTRFFAMYKLVVETGQVTEFEERYHADGMDDWFCVMVTPIPDGIAIATQITTERKRVEEALRDSEERYKTFFENSIDAVFITSPDGTIHSANPEACQIFGMTEEEFIRNGRKTIVDTSDPRLQYALEERTRTGKFKGELNYRRKDGTIFPGEVSTAIFIDKNDLTKTSLIVRDISERKRAGEALKKAHDSLEEKVKERTAELEEAYNLLLENKIRLNDAQKIAHIGNWDWDLITDELYWSDEVYRIFGLNLQELGATYDSFLNYVHPDDRGHVENVIKEALLDGEPFEIDYKIVLANEGERIIHAQGEIIFDEKYTPVRVRGIVQDITERKKAEEKIQTLVNAVESSDDAIITKSLDGIITSWNKGAELTYGYSKEEIIGKNLSILEPDDLKGEIKHFTEKIKRGEKIQHYETLRLKKDGTKINVSATLSPIFNASGDLMAFSAIVRDVTERIKVEEAMEKIEKIRIKEIHHRIKNNLQVISSMLDLQAEKFQDKDVLKAFRESQDRVISMALIHEELYKGKERTETDTLNFSAYIQKLTNSLFQTYRLNNKNISLCMDLEESIFFDMDTAIPLGITVNELVSNSLKHAFFGRDKGEIRIKLHREEKDNDESASYILTVSDNGVGIPENIDIEDLKSLGLQLVTTLVDQLDGELELKSNNGTEFSMRFAIIDRNNQATVPALQQLI